MSTYYSPYLSAFVDLTEERERHIADNHPDLLPEFKTQITKVLENPDQIRISERFKTARLFSKWFDNVRGGKHIVVVVVSEDKPPNRHWIITAYMARKLSGGRIEWPEN